MSSTASSNSQPVAGDRPPRLRRVVPWSWPAGARGLLAALAIIAALGLSFASRDVRSSLEPIAIVPNWCSTRTRRRRKSWRPCRTSRPRREPARGSAGRAAFLLARRRAGSGSRCGSGDPGRIAPHLRRLGLESLASTNGSQLNPSQNRGRHGERRSALRSRHRRRSSLDWSHRLSNRISREISRSDTSNPLGPNPTTKRSLNGPKSTVDSPVAGGKQILPDRRGEGLL